MSCTYACIFRSSKSRRAILPYGYACIKHTILVNMFNVCYMYLQCRCCDLNCTCIHARCVTIYIGMCTSRFVSRHEFLIIRYVTSSWKLLHKNPLTHVLILETTCICLFWNLEFFFVGDKDQIQDLHVEVVWAEIFVKPPREKSSKSKGYGAYSRYLPSSP